MRSSLLLILALLGASVGPNVGCERKTWVIKLATTTSTHNSGLTDVLVAAFAERSGIQVQVFPVGTGQALELGRRGDVDLVLVHARDREDRFVEAGHGIDRRDVMWNDYVIAGPPEDPAAVRGLDSAPEALRRIASSRSRFVSRGDDSGTHIRELSLWQSAGVAIPVAEPHYLSAGQGQASSLVLASEKQAYILTDRGTWYAFAERLALEILVESGPGLRNHYGAILVNPQRHPHVRAAEARQLLDYLVSPEGQRRIDEFQVNGQTLFHSMTTRD